MTFEPKIIAFLCTWCSYTGADTAGIARMKSPANVRAIRVPCSGRVSPEIILKTFEQGADGVLVLGCHIGECHYQNGNHRTAKRIPVLQALLSLVGLERERLHLDWVSASEGERFSRITSEFTQKVRDLGPAKWQVKPGEWDVVYKVWEKKEEILPLPQTDCISRTDAIRMHAHQLLESGEVACVIGYEVSPRGRTRPTFVRTTDEVERLVWNPDCTHNLTNYLPNFIKKLNKGENPTKKVVVTVKPCDSRAINVLLAENRFTRDAIYVLGVTCEGMRSEDGNLQPRCVKCEDEAPIVYDTLIGERVSRGNTNTSTSQDTVLQNLDRLPPSERLEFWMSQFDRCLRCYACRQVCPMCECPECLYERDDSTFAGLGIRLNEKRAFHLGRAYHLAGRCIGCNECERVCPMEIPIGLLNQKISDVIQEEYDFRAGEQVCPSPIVTVLSDGYKEN